MMVHVIIAVCPELCSDEGCTDPEALIIIHHLQLMMVLVFILLVQLRPSCPPVSGCTDITVCNYNPLATEDDGSCLYDDCPWPPVVFGCTYPAACNYNSDANIDDGSCEYPVDENSNCEGCNFGYELVDGVCVQIIYGCTNSEAINYNDLALNDDGLYNFRLY